MFNRMNIRAGEQEFQKLFADLDTNGDGEVTFQEFLSGIRWIQKGATLDWRISMVLDDSEEEEGHDEAAEKKKRLDIYVHVRIFLGVFLFHFFSFLLMAFFFSLLCSNSTRECSSRTGWKQRRRG